MVSVAMGNWLLMKCSFGIGMVLLTACAGVRSRYHTVETGDSFLGIASRYSVPVSPLKENNDQVVRLIPGMKLYIPFEESPEWEKEFREDTQNTPSEQVNFGSVKSRFIWPVRGAISSWFGDRGGEMHEGVDIVATKGTPVRASRSGHVIYSSNKIGGYGNMIIIRHPDHFASVYAHLSSFEVRKGQFVTRGNKIGRVGQTGRATSPHLHFEIRDSRKPVNPLLYLQEHVATNILGR